MKGVLFVSVGLAALIGRAEASGGVKAWATAEVSDDAEAVWTRNGIGERFRMDRVERLPDGGVRCQVTICLPARPGKIGGSPIPYIRFYDRNGRALAECEASEVAAKGWDGTGPPHISLTITFEKVPAQAASATASLSLADTPKVRVGPLGAWPGR